MTTHLTSTHPTTAIDRRLCEIGSGRAARVSRLAAIVSALVAPGVPERGAERCREAAHRRREVLLGVAERRDRELARAASLRML